MLPRTPVTRPSISVRPEALVAHPLSGHYLAIPDGGVARLLSSVFVFRTVLETKGRTLKDMRA